MKKLILSILVLGLSTAAIFAQADSDAPGSSLDLNTPVPAVDGPLTPSVSLDPSPAPTPSGPPAEKTEIVVGPAIEKALAEHTKEEQERFARLLTEASQLMQGNEVQAALERILEAEAIESEFFALHNLKGAAFSKIRDFDKATQSFERCLALNPESTEAKFNLAEMDFVQNKYLPAYDAFTGLMTDNPKMPAHTRNLLLYKRYLCLLLLDRAEEADAIFSTFRFDSDTPEYYFGNAAREFHIDDKEEARGWLKSAARIYNQGLQNLFMDSLIEIGWIDTL